MPWAKVDDSWWCHPKVLPLTMAARGLWTTALSWSCQMRTDYIPQAFVAMTMGLDTDADAIKHLEGSGLWVPVEGGWRIHNWAEYQQKTLSEKRSEAGAKGGRRSRPPKQQGSKAEATASKPQATDRLLGEANGEAGTRPVPSLPKTPNPIVATGAATRKAPSYSDDFNAFWESYPRNPANGKRGGGGTKTEAWEQWRKLTDEDQARAIEACEPHAKALRKSDTPPKHAHRFLRLREFEDVLDATPARSATCATCRGEVGPNHDDLYCDELRAGLQVRHG